MLNCLALSVAITMHLGLQGDYNAIHPHARCDVNNTVAGVYLNSEENISGYVAYQFELPNDIELELGWVSGYTTTSKGIVPMFRITKDRWFITPAYESGPDEKWGVAVGFEIPLYKK